MPKKKKRCLWGVLAVLLLAAPVMAQSKRTRLQWDRSPEPDVSDYRVYRSQTSGTFTTPLAIVPQVAVGLTPEYTTGDQWNGTYYFVVTARNTGGLESGYSNQVSDTILAPPAPPGSLRKALEQIAQGHQTISEGYMALAAAIAEQPAQAAAGEVGTLRVKR